MLQLDHIAVLGETLEEAAGHIEHAVQGPMQPGGRHLRYGTHNRLLGMHPDLYIEAIAIDPGLPAPPDVRWFGLDDFSGAARLDKWIVRTDDLDETLSALPMAGEPVSLQRGDLLWRMAVPQDGQLPFDGLFPAIIEWQSSVPPGKALPKADLSLNRLVVSHPRAPELEALLSPHLDAPLVSFVQGDAELVAELETSEGTFWLR